MTSRIRVSRASDVFEAFPGLRMFTARPPEGVDPASYVRHLLAGPRPKQALTMLAYTLPRREAVWWGRRCLAAMLGPVGEDACARLAEDWVRAPEDETRRAALELGASGDPSSPTTWLALAVGRSGGSVSAPDQKPIPAPPQACAQAVAGALAIAVSQRPPTEIRAWIEACVKGGLAFAEGRDLKISAPGAKEQRV